MIVIDTPKAFSFEECLRVLARSEFENLHRLRDGSVSKLLEIDGSSVLIQVRSAEDDNLQISFRNGVPGLDVRGQIREYVHHWFDLSTPVEEFYRLAEVDVILKALVKRFYGLRIVKLLDLFEGLCWAIIGQQINLRFAYQIKSRLVEKYGRVLDSEGDRFYPFPKPEQVLGLNEIEFKDLQLTRQKIQYLREVAEIIGDGQLKRGMLLKLSEAEVRQRLVQIKGIGNWSANYVMMRCLNFNDAFPIEDVGLHNAIKKSLGLLEKPSLGRVKELARDWGPWRGYATFYLWRSLYS